MSHLILTGATGLVGSAALAHILSLPAGKITKLSILSRRPVPMADGKPNVEILIQNDFSKIEPGVLAKLKGADGCIWAQVSMVFSVSLWVFLTSFLSGNHCVQMQSLAANVHLGNFSNPGYKGVSLNSLCTCSRPCNIAVQAC